MGCSGSFDARLQPGFSGIYVCHALFREQADYLRGESGEDVAEQADVIFFHCRKVLPEFLQRCHGRYLPFVRVPGAFHCFPRSR